MKGDLKMVRELVLSIMIKGGFLDEHRQTHEGGLIYLPTQRTNSPDRWSNAFSRPRKAVLLTVFLNEFSPSSFVVFEQCGEYGFQESISSHGLLFIYRHSSSYEIIVNLGFTVSPMKCRKKRQPSNKSYIDKSKVVCR